MESKDLILVLIPVVVPGLGKEDITGVGHTALVYRVQAHHRHVEQNLSRVTSTSGRH